MNKSQMANDLLSAGIRSFEKDGDTLKEMIKKRILELYSWKKKHDIVCWIDLFLFVFSLHKKKDINFFLISLTCLYYKNYKVKKYWNIYKNDW